MHSYSISQSSSLKKFAQNKIIICFLVLILVFTSFFQSQNRAYANPLALIGGIEVGAGVYVTAALITAGAAGLIGYDEYSDQIHAHASNVWAGANNLSRESLIWSIQQAANAGNAIVGFQGDFINFMEGKLQGISSKVIQDSQMKNPVISDYIVAGTSYAYAPAEAFAFAEYGNSYSVWAAANEINPQLKAYSLNPDGSIQYSSSRINIQISSSQVTGEGPFGYFSRYISEAKYNVLKTMIVSGMTANQIGQAITYATDIPIVVGTYDQALYGGAVSRVREQWESMRDAGLVLPVDSSIPMGSKGEPLTYNPQSDTYTGIDGGVYQGVPTWVFPRIKPRIGEKDIPDGLYVDTPVLTGNPTYDDAIINNPAIPKTTTNINTGVTIANPDIATGNPTIPGEPLPETPGTKPPTLPGSQPILPIAILLALFDLLRAILMYLSRMFAFLVTIPFVTSIPIDNPYFQWFRTATILGVQPYPLVMTTAAFFMSFAAYKSIRRLLP